MRENRKKAELALKEVKERLLHKYLREEAHSLQGWEESRMASRLKNYKNTPLTVERKICYHMRVNPKRVCVTSKTETHDGHQPILPQSGVVIFGPVLTRCGALLNGVRPMSKQTKVNRRTVMAEAKALVKRAKMDCSTAVKQG